MPMIFHSQFKSDEKLILLFIKFTKNVHCKKCLSIYFDMFSNCVCDIFLLGGCFLYKLKIVDQWSTRIVQKILMTLVTLIFGLMTWNIMGCICITYEYNNRNRCHSWIERTRDVPYFSSFIAKSWLNYLEDIAQGQRSLHGTQTLMSVILCAK